MRAAVFCWAALAWSCTGSSAVAPAQHPASARHDAPLVAAQPGAWFDAYGNLTIVGPGRRLRLVLSAPIAACTPAFEGGGAAAEVSARASLPFHVLNEACRAAHPAILLAEESDTASPSELERSYHEVAHCAAVDWALTEGWVPTVVEASDPCPLALGQGWRLPATEELQGLTIDDRKAVAGALFDTDSRSALGSLLLYARPRAGGLAMVTLSPNAAEVAPVLSDVQRTRPFFGATLRCVRSSVLATGAHPTPPVLRNATECLRAQREAQGLVGAAATFEAPPELQRLKSWLDRAQRTPAMLRTESDVQELMRLLAAPALETLARQAREERALTERYAELAEGLDDPAVTEGERERRHAEFDHLRKRLGGQIVHSAEASGVAVDLGAVLVRVQRLLEGVAGQAQGTPKPKLPNLAPLLAQVRALGSGKASVP
jgi:hypothetical protein